MGRKTCKRPLKFLNALLRGESVTWQTEHNPSLTSLDLEIDC